MISDVMAEVAETWDGRHSGRVHALGFVQLSPPCDAGTQSPKPI